MSETGRLWSQGIKVPAIFPAGTELGWAASVPQRARGEDVSTWKLPGDSCGAHESHRALTSSLPTVQEGKVRGFKRERRDDSALLVIRPCGCVASLLCPVRQGMQVQRAEDLEVSVSSS